MSDRNVIRVGLLPLWASAFVYTNPLYKGDRVDHAAPVAACAPAATHSSMRAAPAVRHAAKATLQRNITGHADTRGAGRPPPIAPQRNGKRSVAKTPDRIQTLAALSLHRQPNRDSFMALTSQFLFCLLVAAIVGAIVGWWLRRAAGERERLAMESEHRSVSAAQQQQLSLAVAERDRWQRESDAASGRIQLLEAAHERAMAATATHEGAVKDAQAMIRTRDGQLAEAQNALKIREAEAAEKSVRIATLLQERDALASQCATLAPLPDQLKALEAQHKEAQQNLVTLKARLTKIDTDNSDLHKRLIATEARPMQLADCDQKLKLAKARATELERLASEQEQGLKRRADEAEKLRAEVQSLQTQLAASQAGREADRSAHAAELSRLGAELSALALFKGKFDEADRLRVAAEAEVSRIKPLEQAAVMRADELASELSALKHRHDSDEVERASLRRESHAQAAMLAGAARERDAKQQDYQNLSLKLSQQKAALSSARDEIVRLTAALADSEGTTRLADPRERLSRQQRAYDELARIVRSQASQVVATPPAFARVNREVEEKLAQRVRILEAESLAYSGELAALRAASGGSRHQHHHAVDAQPLPAWGASRPLEIDDLKRIRGVGPVLEKTLHELGIYTFRQIAAWTAQDIQDVDAQLTVFHGRIERDHWVAGAREEHFKKYGERLVDRPGSGSKLGGS